MEMPQQREITPKQSLLGGENFGHSSSSNFLKVSCGADKKQELFQADMNTWYKEFPFS